MEPVRYADSLETIQPNEAEISERIVERMAQTNLQHAEQHQHAIRDAHAKSHALLTGEMTVHDALPTELAQGIFRTPGTFEVVARLSSSPGDIHTDAVPHPRGFALKVIGVPGERLTDTINGHNQDFLMVNFPTLAFGTVARYETMLGILEANAHAPDAAQRLVAATARGAQRAMTSLGASPDATVEGLARDMHNPLGETYFTQGALRYGDYVAKLSIRPASPEVSALTGQDIPSRDFNGIEQTIAEFFRTTPATYELMVQLCTDIDRMPIEDAAVLWDPEVSPFQAVATITFAAQPTDLPARKVFGNDVLSFNPWNGVAEHRPLGSIMRIRKAAYERSTALRHTLNAQTRREPSSASEIPT